MKRALAGVAVASVILATQVFVFNAGKSLGVLIGRNVELCEQGIRQGWLDPEGKARCVENYTKWSLEP